MRAGGTQPGRSGELPRRFGVMLYPDQPLPVLLDRVLWLEELGFDLVYLPDHSADLRNRSGTWFDTWVVLAMAAQATSRIRLGTMVANQILRPPAQLAKTAVTLDHLSAGRFELGLGAGIFPWDHHAVGSRPWTPKERMARLTDYVAIVDRALRGAGTEVDHAGSALWASGVATAPAPVQRPRMPFALGGQSPTVLRLSAAHADIWNTHGPPGASAQQVLDATARQNGLLDVLLSEAGRAPRSVRRSYTIFGSWDPAGGTVGYEDVFDEFEQLGTTEFVLDWPVEHLIDEFERVAREVLPLRRVAPAPPRI